MLTLAYGFPSHVGGLVPWVSNQDPAQLSKRLERLASVVGPGFTVGDLAVLRT
jgi:3-hydroxyacyl-CoA dehydrogenase